MRATQSQSRSLFIRISGGDIFQIFNSQEGKFTFESASWKYSVQPSSLSGTYQFKICYKEGKHVDVFALDKLSLCEGEKGLPHVYNTDKQHRCIYHRPSEEWNASHKITEIIPWISEWFYYYENWLVTAKWLGGGIHRGKKE